MNLDPLSLGIGLGLGLFVALLVLRVRRSTPQVQVREFNTRITSLNLQLDRIKRELSDARVVVARLLDGQQKAAPEGKAIDSQLGDLAVVLTDSEPLNLTHVTGIGPRLAITLASYGITDLSRLASITDREVAVIESSAPALADRMTREKWQEQAIRILESPRSPAGRQNGANTSPIDPYIDQFDWSRLRQTGSINGSTGHSS